MSEDQKPWWQSKTVWGGVVAVGAGVAGIWGYSVSPDDQAAIVDVVAAVTAAFGGGCAIVGRIMATKKVK